MTRICFFREGGRISGFTCSGHAGFSEEGSDIVCSAVTGAIRLTECTINDVLKIGADIGADREKCEIRLALPPGIPPEEDMTCQAALKGLLVFLKELSREYPDNIDVLEV